MKIKSEACFIHGG